MNATQPVISAAGKPLQVTAANFESTVEALDMAEVMRNIAAQPEVSP